MSYLRSPRGLLNQQHTGSVLVPLLVVAIIIVLVLMWQSGMFGGGHSKGSPSSDTAAPVAGNSAESQPTGAGPESAPEPANLPDRPLTEAQQRALRAKNYQPSAERLAAERGEAGATTAEFGEITARATANTGGLLATEAAAVDRAAGQLLANNRPDFSACSNGADADQTLECAAKEQTRVLQAAFAEHNALRTAGDEISIEHGGAIMKQVIDSLQNALEPFVKAADNS